jgi:hypothetical protein
MLFFLKKAYVATKYPLPRRPKRIGNPTPVQGGRGWLRFPDSAKFEALEGDAHSLVQALVWPRFSRQ